MAPLILHDPARISLVARVGREKKGDPEPLTGSPLTVFHMAPFGQGRHPISDMISSRLITSLLCKVRASQAESCAEPVSSSGHGVLWLSFKTAFLRRRKADPTTYAVWKLIAIRRGRLLLATAPSVTQQSGGEEQNRAQKRKHRVDGDPNEP